MTYVLSEMNVKRIQLCTAFFEGSRRSWDDLGNRNSRPTHPWASQIGLVAIPLGPMTEHSAEGKVWDGYFSLSLANCTAHNMGKCCPIVFCLDHGYFIA